MSTGSAIRYAQRWLALDPLHEPAHRELIRLYALDGDRAAALAQYRDCVRTLSQELGVGPVEETAALFEQVSEGTLVPPSPAPAPVPPRRSRAAGRAAARGPRGRAGGARVGATRSRGDGRLAVIEGEAGIGKSRLARELLAAVDGPVLSARCHEDEAGLPYGPVVELLAEAASAASSRRCRRSGSPTRRCSRPSSRGADLPAPMEMSGPAAQTRLLEAIAAVLGVARVVFVDDVHAADEATLDVLAYLGAAAARPADAAAARVAQRRRAARAPAAAARGLGADARPARRGAGGRARRARARSSPTSPAGVYAESEGLPLFVAEYLATLAEGGEPGREMRELVATRVAGLDATARQLLETAAVIGRSFAFEIVRAASGRGDEEATDGLDELVGRGLVRELGDRLRLHARQAARARLRADRPRPAAAAAPARRRGAAADRRGPPAAAAQHLRAAGDDAGAAEQHVIAAEHAASVLAFGDALDHLDAALELGAPTSTSGWATCARWSASTRARWLSYETAAAVSGAELARRRAQARRRATSGAASGTRAQARYTVALEACAADAGLRARILADLSLTLHQAGEPTARPSSPTEARALAESAADQQALGAGAQPARDARARRRPARRRRARSSSAAWRSPRARRRSGAHGRAEQPRAGGARRRASPTARWR